MSLNDMITRAIDQGLPQAFGKIGKVEADYLSGDDVGEMLRTNAGVFPLTPEIVERWCGLYVKAIGCLDGAVAWQHSHRDARLLVEYNGTASVSTRMEDLLPLGSADSWHRTLGNKKVLVVHPMTRTIEAQVKWFSGLWQGAHIGELATVKVPYSPAWTSNAEFSDWLAAFSWLKSEVAKQTFDVAIVGAGAYSLPLLKFIKETLGKPCVHLGGKTQLLFGILGKRWDKFSFEWKEENQYGKHGRWIRPLLIDCPSRRHLVEGGCYW